MTERNTPSEPVRTVYSVPRLVIHTDLGSPGDNATMPLTLAPRTHGSAPTDTSHPQPSADRGRSWLSGLFAGEIAFPAISPVVFVGAGRTPIETDTVARALGCPDLFVIDASDRSARERALVDLARAAAMREERVLVLSPDSHAVDRIAEPCAIGDRLKVVRALAGDENPHRLSPSVMRLTTFETGLGTVERLKQDASESIARLSPKLPPLLTARNALTRMKELVARMTVIESKRDAEEARKSGLELEIRNETGTPIAERLAKLEATVKPFRDASAAATTARQQKDAELEASRECYAEVVAEASRKHGLISRLFSKPKPIANLAELEQQVQELEQESRASAEREARALAEAEAASQAADSQRNRLVSDEIAIRHTEIEKRLASLASLREAVGAEFRDQIAYVFSAGFGVVTPDAGAVERVSDSVQAAIAAIDQPLTAARERLAELSQHGAAHARQLLAEVRIVVGTPASLNEDPIFECAELEQKPPFGLLILDHAEQLNEPDFAALSRLADRWVLAGEATLPESSRGGRHTGRATFLTRVARLLNREPWGIEGERLVCRLAHISPEQRRHLQREPLFDHPHIELRVASDENEQALLAEVAFPAATPIAEAKQFLFRETENVLLRPLGESVWHHGDDRVSVCWPAAETSAIEAWIDLDPGVSEKVIGAGPAAFTAAIVFDAAAGWNSEKAEDWLEARLTTQCTSRVAVLPRAELVTAARHASVG